MTNYLVTVKTNRGNITTSTSADSRYQAIRKITNHYNVSINSAISCRKCK